MYALSGKCFVSSTFSSLRNEHKAVRVWINTDSFPLYLALAIWSWESALPRCLWTRASAWNRSLVGCKVKGWERERAQSPASWERDWKHTAQREEAVLHFWLSKAGWTNGSMTRSLGQLTNKCCHKAKRTRDFWSWSCCQIECTINGGFWFCSRDPLTSS